jgi:tetrathionate reductase subunit A
MQGLAAGRLKLAVVDPRFSSIAAKAWKWLPIKPGTDAALAMAMIRWILEHSRYDYRYLSNANRAAAAADGEPTWTNATWLVKIEPDGRPGAFLRASEVGLGGDADTFVCIQGDRPIAFKSDDAQNPAEGDLFCRHGHSRHPGQERPPDPLGGGAIENDRPVGGNLWPAGQRDRGSG